MFALVALSMLLAIVQCTDKKNVAEYEIKEGIELFHIDFCTNEYFQVFLVEVAVMKSKAKQMLQQNLQSEMNFSMLAKNLSY
jgi:hypothetical protein